MTGAAGPLSEVDALARQHDAAVRHAAQVGLGRPRRHAGQDGQTVVLDLLPV